MLSNQTGYLHHSLELTFGNIFKSQNVNLCTGCLYIKDCPETLSKHEADYVYTFSSLIKIGVPVDIASKMSLPLHTETYFGKKSYLLKHTFGKRCLDNCYFTINITLQIYSRGKFLYPINKRKFFQRELFRTNLIFSRILHRRFLKMN